MSRFFLFATSDLQNSQNLKKIIKTNWNKRKFPISDCYFNNKQTNKFRIEFYYQGENGKKRIIISRVLNL